VQHVGENTSVFKGNLARLQCRYGNLRNGSCVKYEVRKCETDAPCCMVVLFFSDYSQSQRDVNASSGVIWQSLITWLGVSWAQWYHETTTQAAPIAPAHCLHGSSTCTELGALGFICFSFFWIFGSALSSVWPAVQWMGVASHPLLF